ncbi:MAG TPA: PKD domain-containing protein [Bacteroidales bacterium]|nr:PKD domain-containing protein [Bacteroidales bacterium]OQB61915.1 MAG: PKD domain protein [Bacteroidetes bacterium ADurb.Bin145]HOU01883.1 PKD domain-containing protein [Bacteroidales bacterium]HQG63173.1 PKD domain-containing protein [Bacteroidales bacterium]HQK67343.1 PKD domain-containing protein [Bacteroidales bacterium]
MKGKKDDKAFRELFRQKLDNIEVMPSSSTGSDLMRKLAVREFFHFIPNKFNIWYACGIAVAGVAIAVALISGPGRNNEKMPDSASSVLNEIINEAGNERTQGVTVPEPDNSIIAVEKGTEPGRSISRQRAGRTNNSNLISSDHRQAVPSRTETNLSPDKAFFSENPAEKDRLKGVKQLKNIIIPSVIEGCSPLKVRFTNKSSSYETFRWTFGDGGYSEEKEPEWIFDIPGDYEVTLRLYSSNNLKAVSSCMIKVYPVPVARFEIVPADVPQPGENITFYNYSTGAEKFKWIFGDGSTSDLSEPVHSYTKNGNYTIRLVATSEYGCSDTLVVQNAFDAEKYFIEFPNAFIPNPGGPSNGYYSAKTDESASIFHPEADGVSEYQLKIFSKHGILIFESNDINIGWDGYYNSQLCDPGVYIWKVRGNFINREPFTKMGDVTLLKDMK